MTTFDPDLTLAILRRLDAADRAGAEPRAEDLAELAERPVEDVRRLRAESLQRRSMRFEGSELLARADTDEGGIAPESRHDVPHEPDEDGSVAIDGPGVVLYADPADAERAQEPLGSREVEHVASSERACGWAKDVVLQSSWDFVGFFESGAPLLHAHDYESPSIGRVLSMRRARVNGERVIVSRSQFLPAGINSFADMIAEMVRLDFERGVSVGFHIRESMNPTEEERLARGMGPYSVIATKAELIELSVTAIPADKAATKLRALDAELTRAVAEGRFDAALASKFAPTVRALTAQRTAAPEPAAPDLSAVEALLADMRAAHDASEQRILDAVRTLRERIDELAGDASDTPSSAARSGYASLFEQDSEDGETAALRAQLDSLSVAREALSGLSL